MRFAFLAAVTLAMQGCPPSPTPPAPDASDAALPMSDAAPADAAVVVQEASTASVLACANLAAVGCAEGKVSNCAATMDHVLSEHLTTVNLTCLTTKKTKAELRACGFVVCQ